MEQLVVSSGAIIVIDQFMLANEQFFSALSDTGADGQQEVVQRYGGCLVNLSSGTYGVQRDSQLQVIAIRLADGKSAPKGGNSEDLEGLDEVFDEFGPDCTPLSSVLVDTRCLVFADTDILKNDALLGEYRTLRQGDDFKSARDLLRGNGAAVRYGFNRYGDELGVYQRDGLLALWPH